MEHVTKIRLNIMTVLREFFVKFVEYGFIRDYGTNQGLNLNL